jgi:hypothetical protein
MSGLFLTQALPPLIPPLQGGEVRELAYKGERPGSSPQRGEVGRGENLA